MTTGNTIPATDTPWGVAPTAVPCPEWCRTGAGHPYELEDPKGFEQRHHRHQFGLEDSLTVDVTALATWRGDHEEVAPIEIPMWIDGNDAGPDLTTARALELADLLMQAAQFASVLDALET